MSKHRLYMQAIEHCITMAKDSEEPEISRKWLKLADDYRYLLELEAPARQPTTGNQSLLFNNRSYSAAITR